MGVDADGAAERHIVGAVVFGAHVEDFLGALVTCSGEDDVCDTCAGGSLEDVGDVFVFEVLACEVCTDVYQGHRFSRRR